MAIKKITIFGWKGMNNLDTPAASLPDDKRLFTPRLVVNAAVMDSGSMLARGGYALKITLPGVHSLWGGSVMLAVAGETLYRVEGTSLTALGPAGPTGRMNYFELNDRVYLSSPYWNGVYDLLAGTVQPWGILTPGAPEIALVEGDLPPARYSLAYTRLNADGRLSGNGDIKQVTWEGGSRGIQLTNLTEDLVVWITHPNGGKLFLADVNSQGQVTGMAPQVVPLLTQGVQPPPFFSHFFFEHGRMWGVNGKNLHYSEPGQPEWFKRGGYLPFTEDLVMVAPYTGGIYVHSLASTWALDGTDPAKMVKKRVGEGAVPGTLTYAPVPAGIAGGAITSQIFANLSKMPTPLWLSPTGIIIGTHGGNLTNITTSRVNMVVRQEGAALTREVNGLPQVLMAQTGLSEKSDPELQEIFARSGKLFA